MLIALCGAMMTAAPLSSTDYMLELGIFRGVKLAQLAPLAFFCVLFVAYYGIFEKDRKRDTLRFSDITTALQWNIQAAPTNAAAAPASSSVHFFPMGRKDAGSRTTLPWTTSGTIRSPLV